MKKLKKIQLNQAEEPMEANETALTVTEPEEDASFGKMPKWFELAREKIKPFPWKAINGRNALIAGCLVIVAIAGYLNIRYGTAPVSEPKEDENNLVQEEMDAQSYFASAIIDRERARGEALEVLVSITEDAEASESAKTEAYTQMERIANETSWEIDIENLVKAKGFEECVAIINEETANIVVSTEGLTPGEVAQIKEIVFLEASIQPKDIKIIEKNNV
ncbi:MAG: SpoIIIAH-like family protein [Clostridia bacterium]|nr:SpoIIIAH-like family protein [Clostridia bacterium]